MEIINKVLRLDDQQSIFDSVELIDYDSFESILITKEFDGSIKIYMKNIPKKCTKCGINQIGDLIFLTRFLFVRKYDRGKYIIYNIGILYPKDLFQPDTDGTLVLTMHKRDEPLWISKLSGYIDSDELTHLLTDRYFNGKYDILNKFILTIHTKYVEVLVYTIVYNFSNYIIVVLKSIGVDIVEKYLVCNWFPYAYAFVKSEYTNKLFKI